MRWLIVLLKCNQIWTGLVLHIIQTLFVNVSNNFVPIFSPPVNFFGPDRCTTCARSSHFGVCPNFPLIFGADLKKLRFIRVLRTHNGPLHRRRKNHHPKFKDIDIFLQAEKKSLYRTISRFATETDKFVCIMQGL